MGLNKNVNYTQHFVDEYGMMIGQQISWFHDGTFSIGDSIESTCDSYVAYDDKSFIDAIKKCFVYKTESGKTYIQAYRHPSYINKKDYYNDMSRDHIIYALCAFKYAGDTEFLKELSSKLRWKISEKFHMTPDLWLFLKGIAGNWFAMTGFYLLSSLIIPLYNLYNKIIDFTFNYGPDEPQDTFIKTEREQRSNLENFIVDAKYPTYAFKQHNMMIYVANKSIGRFILRFICRPLVDKGNLLLCLFSGKKVKKEDIYNYKAMVGYRWSTSLNRTCTRAECFVIKDPKLREANCVDEDIIRTLYTKIYEKK